MKFFFGLVFGLAVGVAVYFIITPKMFEKSFTQGYDKGIFEGTVKGIEQGKLEQKHLNDSIVAEVAKKAEIIAKRPTKPQPKVYVNPYDKNFSVYGNQVGEERK